MVRRLQDAAIATLWRAHTGLTTAQRAAQSEEVVQEAAQRALKRRGDFDTGRSVVRWLVGFVVMVCRERTRDCHPAGTPAATDDNTLSIEELALDLCRPAEDVVAERVDVRQMLERLPPEDRELVRQRFFDDASFAEIGKKFGISDGAARVRLFRILTRLRTNGEALP